MVLSSSMVRAESIYDNPFFFASRQAIFISIGFIIFCFFLLMPSDFLRKFDWLLLMVSFILLVALFFPGVGTEVNGSMRWIRFGPINIQPSEVAKFCMARSAPLLPTYVGIFSFSYLKSIPAKGCVGGCAGDCMGWL